MKNKRHLWLLFLLSLLFLLLLTSCQSSQAKEEAEEEAALDSVSASISGTVTAFTGKEIGIVTSDNKNLTFDMQKAELECKSGIIPGNSVTLIYVGPLENTDTSKVRLRKIVTTDNNNGLITSSGTKLVKPADTTSFPNDTAGYEEPESGSQVDEKTETVTVRSSVNVRDDAASGSTVLGTLQTGDTVTRTGICDNGWHRIVYEDQTGYVWGEYLN